MEAMANVVWLETRYGVNVKQQQPSKASFSLELKYGECKQVVDTELVSFKHF